MMKDAMIIKQECRIKAGGSCLVSVKEQAVSERQKRAGCMIKTVSVKSSVRMGSEVAYEAYSRFKMAIAVRTSKDITREPVPCELSILAQSPFSFRFLNAVGLIGRYTSGNQGSPFRPVPGQAFPLVWIDG